MASGRADGVLRVTVWVAVTQIACVGVGALFGLLGAGAGFVVAQGVAVTLWLAATRRVVGFSWKDLLRRLRRSAVLAGITAIVPFCCMAVFGLRPNTVVVPLAGCALLGSLLFLLAARWLRHPIDDEVQSLLVRFKRPVNLP